MLSVGRGVSDRHGFAWRPDDWHRHDRSDDLANVQAWLIACDRPDSQSTVDVLTEAEHARSARLARAADRITFTVTRAELRRILARELDVEPRAVRLVEPLSGKPRLCASHERPDIDFSVSHTDGMSVIALARRSSVGVDIERCRAVPEKLKIATEVFGKDAARTLSALAEPKRDEAFLRLWTAGEAYVKAIGTGLAMELASSREPIPLRIRRDDAQVEFCRDFAERDAWRLVSFEVPAGYVCSLATADVGGMPSMAIW
jgi:4'-phosphopantetheinyl transferase